MNPLFIIGAPRSGTNALRDSLTRLPGFYTWPCDEINFIFRHGHALNNHDVLSASDVNRRDQKYIYSFFRQFSSKVSHRISAQSPKGEFTIVEKTCANCLRLPYIYHLFPNARFIFLTRNPYDSVLSTMDRYISKSINFKYLFSKLKYTPLSDLPLYSLSFFYSRFRRLIDPDFPLSTWGPRFPNYDRARSLLSLQAFCFLQWWFCNESASSFFEKHDLPNTQFQRMKYEDFAFTPVDSLSSVLSGLGYEVDDTLISDATLSIHSNSVRSLDSHYPQYVNEISSYAESLAFPDPLLVNSFIDTFSNVKTIHLHS